MKVFVLLLAITYGRNFHFYRQRTQNEAENQNRTPIASQWLQRLGLQLGVFKNQLEGFILFLDLK